MLPLAGARVVDPTSVRARSFRGSTLGAPASAIAGPGRRARVPQRRRKACVALYFFPA